MRSWPHVTIVHCCGTESWIRRRPQALTWLNEETEVRYLSVSESSVYMALYKLLYLLILAWVSENKYSLICSTFTGTLNQLHFILFIHLSSHFIFQFLHVVLWSTLACLLATLSSCVQDDEAHTSSLNRLAPSFRVFNLLTSGISINIIVFMLC